VGVIYRDDERPSLDQRLQKMWAKARAGTVKELMESYQI
jgi:hypothetical protein